MSNSKKLDISYDKLLEISQALNENTINNRTRSKEDKIPTDKFIREKFNINRKNFSCTIKYTDIKYNASAYLYDIPKVNRSNVESEKHKLHKSNTLVNQEENLPCKDIVQLKNEKIHQSNEEVYLEKSKVNSKNTFSIPEEFQEIISLSSDLKDMLKWWKNQTNPNIIDVHIAKIDLHHEKLKGNVITKSYKVYEEVADDFAKFAAEKKTSTKETIKDLVSLALVEFMNKYK